MSGYVVTVTEIGGYAAEDAQSIFGPFRSLWQAKAFADNAERWIGGLENEYGTVISVAVITVHAPTRADLAEQGWKPEEATC